MRDWYLIIAIPTFVLIGVLTRMHPRYDLYCKRFSSIGLCWAFVLMWVLPDSIKEDGTFSDFLDMAFRTTGLYALIALMGATCYYFIKLFFGKIKKEQANDRP